MVEADRLPKYILDICKVFEHIDIIDMLSIGIQQQPSYTVIPILFSPLLPMRLASQLKRRTSSSAQA